MVTRKDILQYADQNYHTKPEHLWAKYPMNEVLRHNRNQKWYALLTDVPRSKVGLEGDEPIDILNVKCEPDMIFTLSAQEGFAPAWHMNKKHWLTIILDGTVADDEVYRLLDLSYELTSEKTIRKTKKGNPMEKQKKITLNNSICGLDCTKCSLKEICAGCESINRQSLHGGCVIAACCHNKGYELCNQCSDSCGLKKRLIAEFNALGIDDMETVTDLNALSGSFINLEYPLPNGQIVKFLHDDKIYLGNQIHKKNSDRCYGLAADESFLLVCEYGESGADAEIVFYKKRMG